MLSEDISNFNKEDFSKIYSSYYSPQPDIFFTQGEKYYKKLKDGNSEEVNDMLESMLRTCMSPNPDIVINDKCLKKEFGQKSRPRRQGNSNAISSYNNITKNCKIKQNSTYKKYVLDPHCKLFD